MNKIIGTLKLLTAFIIAFGFVASLLFTFQSQEDLLVTLVSGVLMATLTFFVEYYLIRTGINEFLNRKLKPSVPLFTGLTLFLLSGIGFVFTPLVTNDLVLIIESFIITILIIVIVVRDFMKIRKVTQN